MASIQRWNGGRWRAHWRSPDGRPQSKVFDRKIDAQRFLTSLEAAKAKGAYINPALGRQKFLGFADDWAATPDWKERAAIRGIRFGPGWSRCSGTFLWQRSTGSGATAGRILGPECTPQPHSTHHQNFQPMTIQLPSM
jgi:hypothetical protein